MALNIILLNKEGKTAGEALITSGKTEIVRNHRGSIGSRIIMNGELSPGAIDDLIKYLHDLKPVFGYEKRFRGPDYVKPKDGIEIENFKPEVE